MEHASKKRYFMLTLEQDMLGEWELGAFFGGLNNGKQAHKWLHFTCEKLARETMFEMENNKRQHGYTYVQYPLEYMFDLIPQLIQDVMASNYCLQSTEPIIVSANEKKISFDQLELL